MPRSSIVPLISIAVLVACRLGWARGLMDPGENLMSVCPAIPIGVEVVRVFPLAAPIDYAAVDR